MARERNSINNAFYEELREGWYTDKAHPIAFLRQENTYRLPWVLERLPPGAKVLDVGCGAGFLANPLAGKGFQMTGIDVSPTSLEIARKFDSMQTVNYLEAKAEELPFEDASFDAVLALDLLEHVEKPAKVILEAGRVLKPGGLFFFHTFNKTPASYLLVIKGMELTLRSGPRDVHIYRLFLDPKDVQSFCLSAEIEVREIIGMRPVILQKALWKLLFKGIVSDSFAFTFTKSLATGYLGWGTKRGLHG